MSDFRELSEIIIKFRDARNWKQFHNPKDVTLSLVLEAAELMEHFQWKNPEEMKTHIRNHKTEISEELADVLYWLLIISHDFEIDLKQALLRKMKISGKKYPVSKSKNNHKKYTEL